MNEIIANFLDIIKNKYVSFNGRARRKEFWYFFLANLIISIPLVIIDSIIGVQVLSGIFSLAVLLPGISCGVRRLHDLGKSGWFYLLGLIPLVNLYLIYLFATEGVRGDNQYGPDPKKNER